MITISGADWFSRRSSTCRLTRDKDELNVFHNIKADDSYCSVWLCTSLKSGLLHSDVCFYASDIRRDVKVYRAAVLTQPFIKNVSLFAATFTSLLHFALVRTDDWHGPTDH